MHDNNRILFVDDENQILLALRRALVDEGFEMYFAVSGAEALSIMEKNEMAVIVADMRMPVMDGLTLLKEVKRRWPLTVRMVLSGYAQMQQIIATVNNVDVFRYLLKPWKLDDGFVEALHQAVEYHNLLKDKEFNQTSLEKKNVMYQGIIRSTEETFKRQQEDLRFLAELNGLMWRIITENVVNGAFDKAAADTMGSFTAMVHAGLRADPASFAPQDLLAGLRDELGKTSGLAPEKISIAEMLRGYYQGRSQLIVALLAFAIAAVTRQRQVTAIFMECQVSEHAASDNYLAFLAEIAVPKEEPIALLKDGKAPYHQTEILLGSVAKYLGGSLVILQHQAALVIRLEVAAKKNAD